MNINAGHGQISKKRIISNNPPTFHEIRSLAARLYKDERGEEFAQKLLGHTSENTTKLYLDERDNKAYVML